MAKKKKAKKPKIEKIKESIKSLSKEEADAIREDDYDRQKARKNKELDEETEKLLDEIDEVLEDEELAKFWQKGGE